METTGFKLPTTVLSMDTTSVIPTSIVGIGTNLGATPGSKELHMLITKVDLTRTKSIIYNGSIPTLKGMPLHHPEGLGGT